VSPYFQVLALLKTFPALLIQIWLFSNHYN
jgi:hypothetical protein